MKASRWLVMMLALLLLPYSCATQAVGGDRFSGTFKVSTLTNYVGGINGQHLHKTPVFQPSFMISDNKTGIYGMLWGSYSPDGGFNSDFGDEVDYIIGISRNISGIGVDISYSFFDVYEVGRISGDLHSFSLRVDLPETYGFSPFINIVGDIPTDEHLLEGGCLYSIGVSRAVGREYFGRDLNLTLSTGGHDGAHGNRPELLSYVRLNAAMDFAVSGSVITPEISFLKNVGRGVSNGGKVEDLIYGGLTFTFNVF